MAIAFDAATAGGYLTSSYSHTCSGSDRIIIVNVINISSTPGTVTYNGVSVTFGFSTASISGFYIHTYYLCAPSTGSNTVSLSSFGSNYSSVTTSYTGVYQASFPDSEADTVGALTTSPVTGSTTVVESNCWLAGSAFCFSPSSAGTVTVDKTERASSVIDGDEIISFDSNGTVSTGSQSAQITLGGSGNWRGGMQLYSIREKVVSGPTNLKSYNTNLKANIKSIDTNLIGNVKSLNTNT